MKRILGTLIGVAVLVIALVLSACSSVPTAPTTTNPPTSTTPPVTTTSPPTTTQPPVVTTPAGFPPPDAALLKVAEDFILNSPTFKFDGIEGSIKFKTDLTILLSSTGRSLFEYEYQTAHPGHGDRSGQMLAQVITTHDLRIVVNNQEMRVVSAMCDGSVDMLLLAKNPIQVSGTVISGGDTTPANGPVDAPRTFTYKIDRTDGPSVLVSYIAYPPSPAGDMAGRKIHLSFRGGSVQVGDFLSAQGTYDPDSNTVMVENENDYIYTTMSDLAAQKLAFDFMKNENATYNFDGVPGSLQLKSIDPGLTSSFRSTSFTFTYQTRQPGHGDRSGQMLAQVITDHTAVISVDMDKGTVRWAACDKTWDMLQNKQLPTYVSGFVVSGGDTTPADGPMDAPRVFSYKVQKDDGSFINVSYTAYPPSPVGDQNRAKITLEFYAGSIQIGDRIDASGMLDEASNTIVIGEQGGYIRTSVPKIQIVGQVTSGGDTTGPNGPTDAPRVFTYQVKKDDGKTVNVSYTAYPPSPVGDANRAKISLTFYNGAIAVGDYLMAYGTYDIVTSSVTVADRGDLIKTYPVHP